MSINIRDANEVNLLAASGIALTGGNGGDAGAGTALDADATNVTFVLTLNTSGTGSATVEIQVSSDNFDDDVRSLGSFGPIDPATDDDEVRYFDAFIPGFPGDVSDDPTTGQINEGGARYVRLFVTTSASAVLTGSTCYARIAGYGRNDPNRTA